MKKLYSKTFDYYNDSKTENARLVISIELNSKVVKEVIILYDIKEETKDWKKIEHFEKMYNIKDWNHSCSKELLLGIVDGDVDFYFEKYALNYDGEKRIRKAILKIVKPDYKYIVERISFDPLNPGIFCEKGINGDNDILAFNNGSSALSRDVLIERTKDYFTFYSDKNFLNFVIDYKKYGILFEVEFSSKNSERVSTFGHCYPESLYCKVSFIKNSNTKESVSLGSIHKFNIELMINNPKAFYEEIMSYIEMCDDILSIEPKMNPLFNSNFLNAEDRNAEDTLLGFMSIGRDSVSYKTFDIITTGKYSSWYTHNNIKYNTRTNIIHLKFEEIVKLFKYDDFHKKLVFDYSNPHVQYIIDTHNAIENWLNIGVYKAELNKWRKENSKDLYMGAGI